MVLKHGSSWPSGWIRAAAEAFATAIAMPDLSGIYDLCCRLQQCQILNPLNEARDWTCILVDTSLIRFCCAAIGTPIFLNVPRFECSWALSSFLPPSLLPSPTDITISTISQASAELCCKLRKDRDITTFGLMLLFFFFLFFHFLKFLVWCFLHVSFENDGHWLTA